jgi:hypothetical protein
MVATVAPTKQFVFALGIKRFPPAPIFADAGVTRTSEEFPQFV